MIPSDLAAGLVFLPIIYLCFCHVVYDSVYHMNHILISQHDLIIALMEALRIRRVFFRYCQPIMYIAGLAAVEARYFLI